MNVPQDCARGTLRLSAGKMTTREEIEEAIEVISHAAQKLRRL
jgi:cysteine sulfinate desulfinase/cysteine desulfurase-like protein